MLAGFCLEAGVLGVLTGECESSPLVSETNGWIPGEHTRDRVHIARSFYPSYGKGFEAVRTMWDRVYAACEAMPPNQFTLFSRLSTDEVAIELHPQLVLSPLTK